MKDICQTCHGKGTVLRTRICIAEACGELRDWCPDCHGAGYHRPASRGDHDDRRNAVAVRGEDWYTAEDAENGYVPSDATWLR